MYSKILDVCEKAVVAIEDMANRVFTPRYNPIYYLGAITVFMFWILIASGVYIFFYYTIRADEVYNSVKYLTKDQWYLGGIMRSLHRYAADGLVLTMVLHTLYTFFTDRYRMYRWVAWISGVFLVFIVWITGVIGYWMVWDERAQILALITTEFLDFLPIFGEPISRAFLSNESVTDIFFFVTLFLHLAVPLLLFIVIWIHLIRISRPAINPPRAIWAAVLLILFTISILKPADILNRADLGRLPADVGIDWFYFFFYPIMNSIPVSVSWLLVTGAFTLLIVLPWLRKTKRPQQAAEVILQSCTGCDQCSKDCPYAAIHMRPRTDGRLYKLEAVVIKQRCANCGICVGSCDFKAIDLPHLTEEQVKNRISQLLAEAKREGKEPVLGFICNKSINLNGHIDSDKNSLKEFSDVKLLHLPCAGMVQPSMIELAFNSGAAGVFITACQMNDCHYREGNKWLFSRLLAERNPVLKRYIDRTRIRVYFFSVLQKTEFFSELNVFLGELKGKKEGVPIYKRLEFKKSFAIPAAAVLSIPAVLIFIFSNFTYSFFEKEESFLRLSLKHEGQRLIPCDDKAFIREQAEKYKKLLEETKRVPMQVIKMAECSRERHPVYIEARIDSKLKLVKSYRATGIKKDGPSFAFERISLPPGEHEIDIRMRDSGKKDSFEYTYMEKIKFESGKMIPLDFDSASKSFYIRK